MTQYIEPNMAMALQYSNQQAMDPSNRYGSGILSLADGGFIGGGNIQGQAMPGGRTGFGFFSKAKKRLKKLIPKELAGIMQVAAPFVAPHSMLGAAALSGLGQYKQSGRINPLQLAMSVAPGLKGRHLDKIGMNKAGNFGTNESVIRNLMQRSNIGSGIDKTLFGSPKTTHMNEFDEIFKVTDPTSGWLGEGGNYGGVGDLVKKGTEAVLFKGKGPNRELDKMALAALALGGMSYLEAKKQFALAGKGDLEDYGITEDVYEATDWTGWAEGTHLEEAAGNAAGGLPRLRQAMGTRPGYLWGSDKGEGLGGEEVEADMRFTGGFMPYGEEPKADDVPARLSKDEFVFTDEAVAGAGDGDVNAGAERLYNIMKQLEQQGSPGGTGIGTIV